MKRKALLIISLLSLPLVTNAAFRCKGQTIRGFSKFDVLRYCGKPEMKDSYLRGGKLFIKDVDTKNSGNKYKTEVISWSEVQQWFYVRGHQKISYTVEFENGRVARVLEGKSRP